MASVVHRAMVYLGLVDEDDEFDYDAEYDDYGEPPAQPYRNQVSYGHQAEMRGHESASAEQTGGTVRTLGHEDPVRSVSQHQPRPSVVRPITTEKTSKVHVVLPTQFRDAQEIADRVKANQPVIVNLQNVDRDLSRRMIDFCSGVTYSLGGSMDKVAEQVFLLTPSNVEVSAEERQRLEQVQFKA